MVDERMNYDEMDKMATEFKNANKQIEDSLRQMQKVAKMAQDGALLGTGGDAYRDAVQQKLIPRMKKISEKMAELHRDIHGAVVANRDGVKTAQSRFK